METTLYRVKFKDGREFQVFCANSAQKRRMHATAQKLTVCEYEVREITNGIHTVKQWEEIASNLK